MLRSVLQSPRIERFAAVKLRVRCAQQREPRVVTMSVVKAASPIERELSPSVFRQRKPPVLVCAEIVPLADGKPAAV